MIDKKHYLKNDKQLIYIFYSKLVNNAEKYENITRSKMLEQIIEAFEKDFKIINIYFTEEELKETNDFIDGKLENEYFFNFFCGFDDDLKIDIYEGFVTFIKKAYDFMLNDDYMNFKEPFYYAVGLILSFGCLKVQDFIKLFNQEYPLINAKKILKSPYVNRYAKVGHKYISLEKIWHIKNYIIDCQNLDFNLNNSKKDFISRGHYLITKETSNYNKVLKSKNLSFILTNEYFTIDAICYAGFANFEAFLAEDFARHDLTEEEFGILIGFFQSLPDWMSKSVSGCLNRRDVDFFYDTFIPFIKWYGKRINCPIEECDNKISQEDVHEVIKKASENNFSLVNEYINKKELTERQINFLQGLKKSIFGNFIVLKNTSEGALFLKDDKVI